MAAVNASQSGTKPMRSTQSSSPLVIQIDKISSIRRDSENLGVRQPDNAAFVSVQEVDQRFPPPQAPHDFLIEIGIGLKANSHY
jgi:hypothetical protein